MKNTVVLALVLLIILNCPNLYSQDGPPQRGHPREKWIDEKATEKAIEKTEEEMSKLEEELLKDKTKLAEKISAEKNDTQKEELQKELLLLEKEYSKKRDWLNMISLTLEILPIEKPTRDINMPSPIIGGCPDLTHLFSGEQRRTIESNGLPQNCQFFRSQTRFQLQIINASEALKQSGCWDRNVDAFVFESPSVMIFYYWNSKTPGGPPIFVFVDIPSVANHSVGNFSEMQRDIFLLDFCPPRQLQKYRPEPENWKQLNYEADAGIDYDQIINNIFGGIGGGRSRTGFNGMAGSIKAQSKEEFEVRNVVFDRDFLEISRAIREPWAEIEKIVLPIIVPQKRLIRAVREIKEDAEKLLAADPKDSAQGITALTEKCRELADLSPEIFSAYVKELHEAELAFADNETKKGKKIIKNFLKKKLSKDEKSLEKEAKPLVGSFERIVSLLGQKEFFHAGETMKNLPKIFPEKKDVPRLNELVKTYRDSARTVQDYIDKQKTVLARNMSEGDLLEPIEIYAGEEVVFHVSATGGEYDFERNSPRWKVILWKSFVPPNPDGTVSKDTPEINDFEYGLFSISELIASGFDTAIIETKNEKRVISAVKGNINGQDIQIALRSFEERDGVSTENMPLAVFLDERNEYKLEWVPIIIGQNRGDGKMVPPGEKFFDTFYFAGRERERLTVFSLVFQTKMEFVSNSMDGNKDFKPMSVPFLLHPGLYKYRIVIIDLLEKNPLKRIVETPLPNFRVLYPKK